MNELKEWIHEQLDKQAHLANIAPNQGTKCHHSANWCTLKEVLGKVIELEKGV